MTEYHAPGRLDELGSAGLSAWNTALSRIFQGQIEYTRSLVDPNPGIAWLFDPISDGTDGVVQAVIEWQAFPRRISVSGLPPTQGWQRADEDRDRHEEYCEWEVARDAQNKVVRVTFTCETADYFNFLFQSDPDLLLRLYQQHVSPLVQLDHLKRPDGTYDPQNVWNYPQRGTNARGILMHMGQRNNSFGAAVNLAAVATWPRFDHGGPVIGEQELIECAKFGEAVRHSDPHIGSEVNKLVRAGNEVSFADPVGLYMNHIDLTDFDVPQGVPAQDLMRVVRGDSSHMLRVIFEAPAGAGFKLGDVRVGGERIRFGGQIAEKVQIRLTGIARPSTAAPPLVACDGSVVHSLVTAEDLRVDSLLSLAATRRDISMSVLSPE